MDKFLAVREVAKRLRIHPETIARYIRQGELPALKFGRVWRMEKEEVDKFIEATKQKKGRNKTI